MPRIVISQQTELSLLAGSIIVTDALNRQQYVSPGANGEVLTIVAGTPTWSALSYPSEFEVYANQGAFPGVGDTDVIYYSTADNAFFIWNGATYVEVPTAGTFSFTASGSGGGINQIISNGDTLTLQTANGFSFTGVAGDIINLAVPTGVSTGQIMTWNNGTSTWSAQTPPALTVAGDSGTNPSIIIGTDTLSIVGGTGIDTSGNTGNDTITIDLNAAIGDLNDVDVTGAAVNNILIFDGTDWVDANGCTWLGNFSVGCLSDVDTTGTGVGDYLAWDGTNFVPTAPAGGFTSWTLAGDAGPSQTIGDLNTASFVGGAGISTTASAVDTLTIAYTGSLNNNSDVNITAAAVNEILVFDGTDWIDTNGCTWLGNFSITCLSDVDTTGVAVGALLYFDGANWVDLAIGAAGEVLTVAGGVPTWAANTGESTTVSDTATVDLTLTGYDITADVLFSSTAGNVATSNATGVLVYPTTEYFSPIVGSTTVTLAVVPIAGSDVQVFRNGVLQIPTTDWTIAGNIVTLTLATLASGGASYGETIQVSYFRS